MTTDPESDGAGAFLPDRRDLRSLERAAASCRGCDLWKTATQVVFGEGQSAARLMLVGEQPGDHEDMEGTPFVGPAGRVLDEALETAGIDRDRAYLTNAVKHFRFEQRGRRRLHKTPARWQVAACGPWLAAELEAVAPDVVVVMGAVAAHALLGDAFSVTRPVVDPARTREAPRAADGIVRRRSRDRRRAPLGLSVVDEPPRRQLLGSDAYRLVRDALRARLDAGA
jgi:uracil-DNA glycosylase